MMQFDRITVFCFFASYCVALMLEGLQFVRRSPGLRWATLGFTGAGLVAHTAYLIARSQQHDLPPLLGSTHDWLLVSAWLAIVVYLGVQLWNWNLSLGIFYLPVVLFMVEASQHVSNRPNPRIGQVYWWSMLHATLWAVGMLGVVLALIVSLMYLVQHHRLKQKQSELPALQLFSLERLNKTNWWLVVLSAPMLTMGMATGLWMTYLANSQEQPVHLVSIAFAANATIWTMMCALFGWLISAKRPTGRLVALRTILVCGFMLAILLITKLLSVDGIHGGGSA